MKRIRRKRTQEQWLEIVQQWEISGQSNAKAWCLKHEVQYESFIIWRKRLKETYQSAKTQSKSAFIELIDNTSVHSGIEIHIQNLRLFLSTSFDQATLLRCLQALEEF